MTGIAPDVNKTNTQGLARGGCSIMWNRKKTNTGDAVLALDLGPHINLEGLTAFAYPMTPIALMILGTLSETGSKGCSG